MPTIEELIDKGNDFRSKHQPLEALKCYATALIENPDAISAFNNYGNVIRECGFPERGVPFLQTAIAMAPNFVTAQFNLAVAYLLMGRYQEGFDLYEWRWRYEHLDGLLPKYEQPRWSGEDLSGKTLLIVGEQGHGDNIQFSRYVTDLERAGARVILHLSSLLAPLFPETATRQVVTYDQTPTGFDYWTPIMSIPGIMGTTLENLEHRLQYIYAGTAKVQEWSERLGPKQKLRVGVCWTGRPDSWINQHKAMPFDTMLGLIQRNPDYEWINLQVDCSEEQRGALLDTGVACYSENIKSFDDTAGLIHHCDVVVSVDTSVAHLSGAMGRPTWIPLNMFGQCWRWLLKREDSPWYPSARLFRQESIGDWSSPVERIHNHLKLFKI